MGFKSQAEQEIAELLKAPINQVKLFFGADAKSQLETDWIEKILPKAREIQNGYPFTDDGEADLTKLTAFLNPINGELSTFYKERLKDSFEEKDGRLIVKESSQIQFTPEFVEYLNNAFKLRRILYGDANNPNFKYDFRILRNPEAIIEVTIDGQTVTSEATGSSVLGFPAAQGQSTGVLMRFSSTSGTSSTSGNTLPATSSANSSDSSVSSTSSNFLQDGGEVEKRFPGTWGLFKFVDAGSKEKAGDQYNLTYSLGGKTVQATIKPQGGDLFDKSVFRTVNAPENMIR